MTSESTQSPDEPRVSDVTFQEFYGAMMDRERLQVSRDEAVWTEDGAAPDRAVDVLLNFGCNVRQSPHLQREAAAVLDALGVDFAAVAGQKYCCGKIYTSFGFPESAQQIITKSVRRLAAYQPKRTLQWCSACEMQFSDVVHPNPEFNFKTEGFAAFLVQRIDELASDVPWKSGVDIKAVVHGHIGEHPVRDSHPGIVMELLRRIPGVQVVGYADTPALDICDNAGPKIATIGTDEYKAAQAAMESYLDKAAADTMVTLYHSCTRELSKFASEKLKIRHYVSVLAAALGVSKPDRFSEYWRLGDPQRVMEASRPNWTSWGITEEEALRLAHKYFVPSYAEDVPECPCNGACSRTGAAWLLPRKKSQESNTGLESAAALALPGPPVQQATKNRR
jgi:Fe-S oxidoreductase